jgi:hypothetical protein
MKLLETPRFGVLRASRLSVLKGHRGCLGMREGAATKQVRTRIRTPREIVGDGSEETDFTFGTEFSDGDAVQPIRVCRNCGATHTIMQGIKG